MYIYVYNVYVHVYVYMDMDINDGCKRGYNLKVSGTLQQGKEHWTVAASHK